MLLDDPELGVTVEEALWLTAPSPEILSLVARDLRLTLLAAAMLEVVAFLVIGAVLEAKLSSELLSMLEMEDTLLLAVGETESILLLTIVEVELVVIISRVEGTLLSMLDVMLVLLLAPETDELSIAVRSS